MSEQTPDMSHPGAGLDEATAQQVASLRTARDTDGPRSRVPAMDSDTQAGRGADGDSTGPGGAQERDDLGATGMDPDRHG